MFIVVVHQGILILLTPTLCPTLIGRDDNISFTLKIKINLHFLIF